VLDSCELMHYLHPELPSHSLEFLLRWAGKGPRSRHRAMTDCEATHSVLLHAFEGCLRDGRAEDLAELLETLDPRAALRLAQIEAGESGMELDGALEPRSWRCSPGCGTCAAHAPPRSS
jgi:ATP-dependent DNA helicase DinG